MTPGHPTFLVIGAARSGTTGLIEGLRTHPNVFVTSPKEPHYFAFHGMQPAFTGPGDDRMVNQVAVTDRRAYLSLYPADSRYLALGEGSVSTLYYRKHALPEILRINPAMKVIIVLRDPVARAYSSYLYLRNLGLEPMSDFAEAVAAEPRRRRAGWHHLWHYTGMSMYSDALTDVQETLPAEQIGVWFHDEMEADYAGTIRNILSFLDVPSVGSVAEGVPRVNASGAPTSLRLQRVLLWATRQEAIRGGIRLLTTYRFRERLRAKTIRRQTVPEPVENLLHSRFAEDIARLRDALHVEEHRIPQWVRESER